MVLKERVLEAQRYDLMQIKEQETEKKKMDFKKKRKDKNNKWK